MVFFSTQFNSSGNAQLIVDGKVGKASDAPLIFFIKRVSKLWNKNVYLSNDPLKTTLERFGGLF